LNWLAGVQTLARMKFAICNEIFQGWKIDDVLSYAAKLGYGGVEIAPFTLANSVTEISAAQRSRLREVAGRTGVEIIGIHWVLVKPEGLYINHPDSQIRERTSDYFCELVDFCADLGGSRMIVGSPKQRNVLPGVSFEQARDWAIDTFSDAVARAEERKVTVCFEPLGPSETNFINSAAEAIAFVRRLPSPYFQIILDVKAMSAEPAPIPQIIRQAWPHFRHFHANDPNLKGPGFGEVDFRPIAAALNGVGYDGFVSVEVFNFDEGAETIASKSLAYLRQVFE
jgi:sugar phosphate isomerase/epimerase